MPLPKSRPGLSILALSGILAAQLACGICFAQTPSSPAPAPAAPARGARARTPSTDAKWEPAIKAFEAEDAAHPPPKGAYLFIGSSSIRGWKTLAQDFPNVAVINRGFGGSELHNATDFIDRIVVPYRPKMIILYSGDNDITAGKKSPQEVFAEFKFFVAKVRARLPKTPIVYIAMKPALDTWVEFGEKMRVGNELIRNYIKTDPSLTYIDVFTPMLGADGTPRPELFGPDKEHMTPAGYALWTSLVKPVVK